MRIPLSLWFCAAVAACAAQPQVAVVPPHLPDHAFATLQDNDAGALTQAQWAFADPDRTRNNPAAAAKAVVAVEYLADDLRADPKWVYLPASTRERMLGARADLRALLGIRLDAPPQVVVDALLAAADALQAGRRDAAMAALSGASFTRSPPETLAILGRMPLVSTASVASSLAYSGQFPFPYINERND